jgi:hypothetical protein
MRAEILCQLFDLSPVEPGGPAELSDGESRDSQQALDRAIAEPASSERKVAT